MESLEQPLSNPQWAPDGKWIAYTFGQKLFIVDSCGKNHIKLAGNVENYSWSPNSTMIVYTNIVENILERGTFVVNLDGETKKIAENFANPVWFPDNKRLAGITLREAAYPRLAIIAAIVKISPNGRYAATSLLHGSAFSVTSGVWIYDFVTEKVMQLPGFLFEQPPFKYDINRLGGWSPDSSKLVYKYEWSRRG
ncbi:MAG: PD40 domain-containing protein [Halanaerobiales bacterium]|nr:PD40 domain-containing protein [Halanaerobiales bacterium]